MASPLQAARAPRATADSTRRAPTINSAKPVCVVTNSMPYQNTSLFRRDCRLQQRKLGRCRTFLVRLRRLSRGVLPCVPGRILQPMFAMYQKLTPLTPSGLPAFCQVASGDGLTLMGCSCARCIDGYWFDGSSQSCQPCLPLLAFISIVSKEPRSRRRTGQL